MGLNVLVIDVGGSHVKLACTGIADSKRFDSGSDLTPAKMMEQIELLTAGWEYEAVSLGIPALVGPSGATAEPGNLGSGWVGFDFAKAFDRPTRVVNDAALQALGAYDGGRMLFLGLGTGLGSTLIADRVVIPLELGAIHNLDRDNREYLGKRLGKENLEKIGETEWKRLATDAICMLKDAFYADYVVIGGGHAGLVVPLPKGVRCGGNDDAFAGGFRMWEQYSEPHAKPATSAFRVVR